MAEPLNKQVRVFATREDLSRAAAERLVGLILEAADERGRFSMALSGGTTPQIFYQLLAGEFTDRIPWDKVHLYWGDERYVSQRDTRSNFRMFHETVLQYVHVPLGNIHPMPTHRKDPADAARDYEAFMKTQFQGKLARFDGILLGVGKEGHTASIFPRSPALEKTDRWVMAVEVPADPSTRLTLTLPVLNAAAHVCFLVSGQEKADLVKRVLNESGGTTVYPASAVQPTDGDVIWCLDKEAASGLGDELADGTPVERVAGRKES